MRRDVRLARGGALRLALAWGMLVVLPTSGAGEDAAAPVRIGSKKFTEAVILGELGAQLAESEGATSEHRAELGGTRILWNALLQGAIDVYPEYTGTLREEVFRGRELADVAALREALAAQGIRLGKPLGFNNTYVLGMTRARAGELGIRRISDLIRHPTLRLAFSDEFLNRGDGWPSLRDHYRLPHRDVRGIDHDLAYRGLESGALDVIDLYSTDAEILYYDLALLEDDLGFFTRYEAAWLYRDDLATRAPGVVEALGRLEGAISESEMVALNARVKLDKESESCVAAGFLARELGLRSDTFERCQAGGGSPAREILGRVFASTVEHIGLVAQSLLPAILVAVPLGVLASRRRLFGQTILAMVGIVQTIPALALLVLLMSLLVPLRRFGIESVGDPPAVVALFLYSLLPIVRNTYTGMVEIPGELRESAEALGLPARARLWRVELPLAARNILSGVKTAAVINIGFATLGALIGAGGYGQPILTGIRLDDTSLILQGALPAAGLALLAQGAFELAERVLVPKGLRLDGGA